MRGEGGLDFAFLKDAADALLRPFSSKGMRSMLPVPMGGADLWTLAGSVCAWREKG